MKKVNGQAKKSHYEVIDYETGEIIDLKPEYTTMSRKPGIAGDWFDKYHPDVYPSDSIHVDGREMRPPKFYDKKIGAYQTLHKLLKVNNIEGTIFREMFRGISEGNKGIKGMK
jgi:hypothetical protein